MKSKPPTNPDTQTAEDHAAVIKSTPSQDNNVQSSITERISERKSERFTENAVIPLKRRTKRYSFEFYDDQILAIKRLVYEANLSGQSISQSDIVRTALDQYLKEEK